MVVIFAFLCDFNLECECGFSKSSFVAFHTRHSMNSVQIGHSGQEEREDSSCRIRREKRALNREDRLGLLVNVCEPRHAAPVNFKSSQRESSNLQRPICYPAALSQYSHPHDMRSKLDEPLLPLDTERQERMRACLPRVSRCHLPELTDYF